MPDSAKHYDAIVIGSGQGGNPLCQKLAASGQKVALIESSLLGGTCINTGCTPTKTVIASAQVAHYARQSERWGVKTSGVQVDLPAIVARTDKIVAEFRGGWQSKIDKLPNLDLYRGIGRFVSPKQIKVNSDLLQSDRIFIDTGSSSIIPEIPGLTAIPFLTNETLLQLTSLPSHLIVIGGGYIGLEFAQMYRRFGCEVTVVQKSSRLLPREDDDIADALQHALNSEGICFLLDAEVLAASGEGTNLSVMVKVAGQEQTVLGSHILVATGRKPNTAELNLSAAGVATDDGGHVIVNGRLGTNVEGIWALGDVTGGPAFTHISYNDFQIIYGNLYEGKNLTTNNRVVPYAIFTDPQLGRVGITESDARKSGKPIKIGSVRMTGVARAIERGETEGMMKIVVDATNDQVLGAAILATEGGEVVQILHTLMLAEKPYTLLKGSIFIHPTIAEGFFGLLESVKASD